MSARAGIVVTGTEILGGRVQDRNGPWMAERLREMGVDTAHIVVVGDRTEDMVASLRFLSEEGVDLICTSGGLGPTADDLTAQVVAGFQGREMRLDEALEARIAEILKPLLKRWPQLDQAAIRESNRKQAMVPDGATVLPPVGTAPGLVVTPAAGTGPTVVVLPGPPRELQPMWRTAIATDAFAAAVTGATEYRQVMLRLFGIPESELAATLRAVQDGGTPLHQIEVTTCMRRGELEIVSRYEPRHEDVYVALDAAMRSRHGDVLFSDDGSTVDEQVAALLLGEAGSVAQTIAVAESCTAGLLASRLTERPGSSAYVLGGLVVYSNAAKVALAGVDPALLETHGAVSAEVAVALAEGAIDRLDADVGVGITGIAGPGGATEDKPVGRICLCAAERDGARIVRVLDMPGDRHSVRDRATTVAMHMIRRLLLGDDDVAGSVSADVARPGRA